MTGECSYTSTEVAAAMNKAADHILTALDAPDEGVRDVVNLMVNTTAHYLDNPDGTLQTAIAAAYSPEDVESVLDWCGEAIR